MKRLLIAIVSVIMIVSPAHAATPVYVSPCYVIQTGATANSISFEYGVGTVPGYTYEAWLGTNSGMHYYNKSGAICDTGWNGLGSNQTKSYTISGLQPNTEYTYYFFVFHCTWSQQLGPAVVKFRTLPTTPTPTVLQKGTVAWSNVGGKGYVVLNWDASPVATGYKVHVFDGNQYHSFDIGNSTTWDSRVGKIMPSVTTLNSYGNNSQSSDLFNHINGGEDLADSPNLLYKKTAGTLNDGDNCYYFKVSAYTEFGESALSLPISVTLPNSTDSQAPRVTNIQINGGAANTGSSTVTLNITANDPLVTNYTSSDTDDASGIVKYQISNDNFVTYTDYVTSSTSAAINWNLINGDGSKNIYVRAVDGAGNQSATQSASIYLNNDVIPPVITATVNNNLPYTDSNLVDFSISMNDNSTTVDKLQYRMSIDGVNWYYYNASTRQWSSGWGSYTPLSPGFNIGTDGGFIYVFVQGKDANGNIGNAIVSITYATPATSPTAATGFTDPAITATSISEGMNGQVISVNGTKMQVAQSSTVDLQMTGLTNVKKVYASFDGVNWGTGDVLATGATSYTKSVTFNQQGKMAVYLKFENKGGYESQIVTRRYLVDYLPPEGSVSCVGSDATSAPTMKLNLKYKDNVSSVLRYSINGGTYTTLPSDGLIDVPLALSGLNDVSIKIIDEAGNVASDTISVWKL